MNESKKGGNKKKKIYKRNKRNTNIPNPPNTHTYVYVSGGKKYSFFWKIWLALFSCYLHFEIHPFALLPSNLPLKV